MPEPDPRPAAATLPPRLNVLLIGGGGREHALARKLSQSPRLATLWTTHPENPGLSRLARAVDVPVSIQEFYRLEQFCKKHEIHLAVIGPEEPLAQGFADRLRALGVLVFGPSAEAARIESDKAWAKQLMRSASIPTAEARIFSDPEGALTYIETRVTDDEVLRALFEKALAYRDPAERRAFLTRAISTDAAVKAAYHTPRPDLPVIKASGLAKGKGVVVPATLAQAAEAIDSIMVRRQFGDAGKQVVLEEKLSGPEASLLAIVDGRNILLLPPCQDHKRLGDGDQGPNTGGMGAFCPTALLDDKTLERVEREILVPTVDAMRRDGVEFTGVLYAGLMLTHAGPKALEFNARFGDPECQPLLARLRSDLLELLLAACAGRLGDIEVEWDPAVACCVVLASEGYPEKPRAGAVITGVDEAEALPGVFVDHAGTRVDAQGRLVTAGGRVLGVTGLGASLEAARAKAYAACDLIRFEGKVMRRDIGAAAAPRARRR
jgi:phosphoribosylamine--glycine ligase